MNIRIIKPCDLKQDGTTKSIQAGALLNLPDTRAQRLIDAGYAESINTAEEARETITNFGKRDPGGDCWEWIKKHMPDLWRSHVKALLADDISTARLTFNKMIEAWEHRQEHNQPSLMAA